MLRKILKDIIYLKSSKCSFGGSDEEQPPKRRCLPSSLTGPPARPSAIPSASSGGSSGPSAPDRRRQQSEALHQQYINSPEYQIQRNINNKRNNGKIYNEIYQTALDNFASEEQAEIEANELLQLFLSTKSRSQLLIQQQLFRNAHEQERLDRATQRANSRQRFDAFRLARQISMDDAEADALIATRVPITPAETAASKALISAAVAEQPPVLNPCVICLGDLDDGDIIFKTSCGHTFHKECLIAYLIGLRIPNCPLCRNTFLPEEINRINN